MYSHTPPVPPPKPGSHDVSRISTPGLSQSPAPPPLPEAPSRSSDLYHASNIGLQVTQPEPIPDPGDQWLPRYLEDKSKQDLADILSSPPLLSALTHSPATIHPSVAAGHDALQAALAENLDLATRLLELERHLHAARQDTQARLLSAHALERAWRAKQADMDVALAPFAPASLYQRLGQGVAEQEAVCRALEESFLDGGGGVERSGNGSGSGSGGEGAALDGERDGGVAAEREVAEWVKRYREAKKLYFLRRERKDRWDEGRVGGWR